MFLDVCLILDSDHFKLLVTPELYVIMMLPLLM